MTQRRFGLNEAKRIIKSMTSGTSVAEKMLANGSVFVKDASGSGSIISSKMLNKHYDQKMNVTKPVQTRDNMSDLALEGLESSIARDNPFHNKQHGQATFGNPWAESDRESSAGLPSDEEERRSLPSQSAEHRRDEAILRRAGSGLPSSKKF